jgi:hypothetical protein
MLNEWVIPAFSGGPVELSLEAAFGVLVLAGLFLVSVTAVAVCAFSRPVTLALLNDVLSMDIDHAKKIETLLKVLVSIGGTVALIVFSII